PWMPEERRKDAAGWKKVAQSMNRIAIDAKQRGFNVAYHNHSFEFQKFDGQYGLDIVWANSDALRSELDTYWVAHGGLDPVAYINQLGRRILLLHLKDMAPGADRKFAPVGSGTLDFKTILDAGNKAGVQWGIVEQDNCYATPPLQAIRTSFENLKQLGAA
ncbi:MAG: sugar phosphate isomerase/epimerase family protein, partial [Tepidisphaeraceae bacterium]